MSRISETADRFRRQILTHEEEAASTLVVQYGEVYRALSEELDSVLFDIQKLVSMGRVISENLLYRSTRLQALLQQTAAQIQEFNRYAEAHTALEQAFAVERSQEHAAGMIRAAIGPVPAGFNIPQNFLQFNPRAVETFIGRASNGSPLADLFDSFAGELTHSVRSVFVKALVAGASPKQAASALREEFNVPLARSLTIARTEVLTAYREANLERYRENPRVVVKWRWQCAFNSRTCAMCIAMDGHEFDTDVSQGTHPNCRCTCVPVTRSWSELGFEGVPDRRSRSTVTGEDWFGKQDEETQLSILGPGKLERYKAGDLTLSELVGYREDPAWGATRWERSLKAIDAGEHAPTAEALGILPSRTRSGG